MEIFYQEKSISLWEKIRKNDFAPSEKFSCYAPDVTEACPTPLENLNFLHLLYLLLSKKNFSPKN